MKGSWKWRRLLLPGVWVALVIGVAWVGVVPAAGEAGEVGEVGEAIEPPFGMNAFTYARWKRQYVRLSNKIALVGGQYVACPAFDPRHPSSVGMTVREATRRMAREEVEVSGILVRYATIEPPLAEVQAVVMALPSLDVGAYGWVRAVRVDEILGPREMVVRGLRLIDEDELRDELRAAERRADDRDSAGEGGEVEQAFQYRVGLAERQDDRAYREEMRVVGFATADLAERQWWAGPNGGGLKIAIVEHEVDDSGYRERRRRVAIAMDLFENRIREAEFYRLLRKNDLDGTGFLEMAAKMHREHRGEEGEATRALLARLVPSFKGKAGDKQTP